MMSIDLNALVKVKLTEFGYKIWLNYNNELENNLSNKNFKNIYSEIESDGYLTTTLANLMNIFGPFISEESPFEDMSVLIDEKDIIEYQFIKNLIYYGDY